MYLSSFTDHAFVYSNGTMTDLSTPIGVPGIATAINDSGQIVGFSELTSDPDGPTHAFNFTTDTDMGTLGGNGSHAFGINASGQVVGDSYTANGTWHPFLYANGHITDLGTLGGVWVDGGAGGINTGGQIVGYMENPITGAEHAFLYSNGQMIDLNSLISPTSGWTLQAAGSINDSGQIVGQGIS